MKIRIYQDSEDRAPFQIGQYGQKNDRKERGKP